MEMKLYVLNFNTEIFKIEADVVTIEYENMEEQYQKIADILKTDGLDVIDYDENIAILVDDMGFYKQGNPIYNLILPDGITTNLAGKLVFVRNIYTEYSTDFGSITYQDIFNLRRLLNIQIIGSVK